MNALPIARPHDWLGSSLQQEGRPSGPAKSGAANSGLATSDAGQLAVDAGDGHRLALTQDGFLALRLEAALGRLAATETLLAAERLHGRETQEALALSERGLEQRREASASSDQRHRAVATELERLKESLHVATLDNIRQGHQIAGLTAALASRTAEMERLRDAGAALEADLRTIRAKQNAATDVLHRECQRLEGALQRERGDKVLLQCALDLARANRRALQAHIEQRIEPSAGLAAAPSPLGIPPARAPFGQASSSTAILLSSNGDHHAACS